MVKITKLRYFVNVIVRLLTDQDCLKEAQSCGYFNPEFWPCELRQAIASFQDTYENNAFKARVALRQFVENNQELEKLILDKNRDPLTFQEFNPDEILEDFQRMSTVVQADELIEQLKSNPEKLKKLAEKYGQTAFREVSFVDAHDWDSVYQEQEKRVRAGQSVVLLPGFETLSRHLGGFNPGRVTMISAKTGVGKTALALSLASAASKIAGTIYFNMEMTSHDIMSRIVCSSTNTRFEDWQSGNFFPENSKVGKNYKISTGEKLSLPQIISSIKTKARQGHKFFFVDYDQKIAVNERDEQWKSLHAAVEGIEEIAKETQTHAFLLAQERESDRPGQGGSPRASTRMVQSVSAHLSFCSLDEQHFLDIKKNRFGPMNFQKVFKVYFDTSTGKITEFGLVNRDDLLCPALSNA